MQLTTHLLFHPAEIGKLKGDNLQGIVDDLHQARVQVICALAFTALTVIAVLFGAGASLFGATALTFGVLGVAMTYSASNQLVDRAGTDQALQTHLKTFFPTPEFPGQGHRLGK